MHVLYGGRRCNELEQSSPGASTTASIEAGEDFAEIIAKARRELDVGGAAAMPGTVASAQHLGYATSALLLISTLTFGFAIAALIELTSSSQAVQMHSMLLSDSVVVCLFSASASLSVVTTTFGLLEHYYVEMIGGADERLRVQDSAEAIKLEMQFKQILIAFNRDRARARNCMWGGLVTIMFAGAVQLNRDLLSKLGLNRDLPEIFYYCGHALASLVLLLGVVFVYKTVRRFRHMYRPLLREYHLGYA